MSVNVSHTVVCLTVSIAIHTIYSIYAINKHSTLLFTVFIPCNLQTTDSNRFCIGLYFTIKWNNWHQIQFLLRLQPPNKFKNSLDLIKRENLTSYIQTNNKQAEHSKNKLRMMRQIARYTRPWQSLLLQELYVETLVSWWR